MDESPLKLVGRTADGEAVRSRAGSDVARLRAGRDAVRGVDDHAWTMAMSLRSCAFRGVLQSAAMVSGGRGSGFGGWGPFGDHTWCAIMNDLRTCDRGARSLGHVYRV
jgi:hypothetical protein